MSGGEGFLPSTVWSPVIFYLSKKAEWESHQKCIFQNGNIEIIIYKQELKSKQARKTQNPRENKNIE